jgi:hypothetical protein
MRTLRKSHPGTMFCVWFLTVFLVLFPKGGIKLGNLPLTWGYMFLALTSPPLLVLRLVAMPLRIPIRLWAIIAILVPMQLLCIYSATFNGVQEYSFAISTVAGLFFLPWIFLLIYPPFLRYIDAERFSRYLRFCVLAAAIWGIFLFFWHPLTGHFVEIPYLTVNIDDFGDLEYTKHINRGLFFKLISTYNNGNLYGTATLILLPLYDFLEKARWRRIVVKLALLMTLSRTVWAGLVFAELMPLGILVWQQFGTFPRLYLGRASKQVFTLLLTIGLIFAALLFNSSSLSFLFDPTLGGRTSMFGMILNATILPSKSFFAFSEAIYGSAADRFGYAGLLAFTMIMLSPVILLFIDSSALQSGSRMAALRGLILYAFLGTSDAGFNFLPVMAFYWFVYMIYLFGWPGTQSDAVPVARSVRIPGSPIMPPSVLGEAAR